MSKVACLIISQSEMNIAILKTSSYTVGI